MSARLYHFVVVYDEANDIFDLDYDTQEARFNDGPIYNSETDKWERLTDADLAFENSSYLRAADALYRVVTDLELREVSE